MTKLNPARLLSITLIYIVYADSCRGVIVTNDSTLFEGNHDNWCAENVDETNAMRMHLRKWWQSRIDGAVVLSMVRDKGVEVVESLVYIDTVLGCRIKWNVNTVYFWNVIRKECTWIVFQSVQQPRSNLFYQSLIQSVFYLFPFYGYSAVYLSTNRTFWRDFVHICSTEVKQRDWLFCNDLIVRKASHTETCPGRRICLVEFRKIYSLPLSRSSVHLK